jgi:AcrR family transcriptional regulator
VDTAEPLRDRLVAAGVEILEQDGLAELSLRAVTRRTGVSHGAPRRYFPTHRGLLAAIARTGLEDLTARLGPILADAEIPPRQRLIRLGEVYLQFAEDRLAMFELMFRHDLLDSTDEPAGPPRLRETTVPLFTLIADLVAACGPPTSTPPHVTAAALWANIHGIAQLWTWGSLQLVLGTVRDADPRDQPAAVLDATVDQRAAVLDATVDQRAAVLDEPLDRLVAAALDAHLGPATA